MDVLAKVILGICALSLVACGKQSDGGEPTLKSNAGACAAQEVSNQYIAKWKDGRMSRLKVSNKNALIEKFIEPNREALEFVEPDTYIDIPAPVVEKSIAAMAAIEINWQHTAIQSAYAWDQNLIGADVIVAVVDSGVDVTHPQLVNHIATNNSEVAGNGVDDDGNGYVDDHHGYDFFKRSGNITDKHGHGTHVSGIIAAEHTADAALPKGIAPGVKILPLNFMDDQGRGSTSNAILALRYAKERGAKIVNASWGSGDCSVALKETIQELSGAGILVVAAAGNSGLNIDLYPNYPAAYKSANMLAVAASTSRGLTADFSNYSINAVHVAAPGKDIFSSTPSDSYAFFSGTSMAAPLVSGMAAIIWAHFPEKTMTEIKAAIMDGTEGEFYPVVTRGEVDVKKTLQSLGL